jgi:hypothetical protein
MGEVDQILCSTCDVIQQDKSPYTKYERFPEKDVEQEPWECLCVDMIASSYRCN